MKKLGLFSWWMNEIKCRVDAQNRDMRMDRKRLIDGVVQSTYLYLTRSPYPTGPTTYYYYHT